MPLFRLFFLSTCFRSLAEVHCTDLPLCRQSVQLPSWRANTVSTVMLVNLHAAACKLTLNSLQFTQFRGGEAIPPFFAPSAPYK